MLSGERPIIQLEGSESVCFPSFRANQGLLVQDTQRECGNSFDLSAVAGTTRVSSIVRVDDGYPHYYSSTSSTPIVSGRPPTPTNRDGINHSNRLEVIRRDFAGRGLSSNVVNLLLAGVRPTTQTAYQSPWSSWCDWCTQRNINPLSNAINNVLEFLSNLFAQGKAYNTINVARSMLSGTLPPLDGNPVGKHYLVLKLMKGMYNSNPPKPRYESTWSIDLVTNYVNTLPSNADLSLAEISRKLAVLLALTTMLRVSELASIDRQSVKIGDDRALFSLTKPRKAQKDGALHNIVIKKFPNNPNICPVSCLGYYIFQTDSLRNSTNANLLFLAMKKPNKPVTGSSIGRWIKSLLGKAGVDTSTFKAHSTRGAAASKAARSGVPVDTILKTAHWSNESTYTKFYFREVQQSENISEAVLNGDDENSDA